MKKLSISLVSCLLVAVMSCSSVYDVSYDYDKQTNFGGLKTYNWLPKPPEAEIDSLNLERIRNAVNAQLESRGLRISSENPDFLIATHAGQKKQTIIIDRGYGSGPYWGAWGGGPVKTYSYEEGTLILDFVDAESKNLIWRGSARAALNPATTPEKKEKLISEAVEKILKNFPPVFPR